MHLEKGKIWARVGEPAVVEVRARVRVRAKAKAVVVVEIKVVPTVPADIVCVQNVAKKCPISEE
jgi:hypothetical protein